MRSSGIQIRLVEARRVRVEANKNPLAAVHHHEVVVPNLLVALVIPDVAIFIRLGGKKGIANQLAVVDAAAVRAIAVRADVERFVVHKARETLADGVAHANFSRASLNASRTRIVGKGALEARGTVAVIASIASAKVNVRNAHRTKLAAAAGANIATRHVLVVLAEDRAAALTATVPLPTMRAHSGGVFAILAPGLVATMLAKRVRRTLSAVLRYHIVLAIACAAIPARELAAAVLAIVLRAAHAATNLAIAMLAYDWCFLWAHAL